MSVTTTYHGVIEIKGEQGKYHAAITICHGKLVCAVVEMVDGSSMIATIALNWDEIVGLRGLLDELIKEYTKLNLE